MRLRPPTLRRCLVPALVAVVALASLPTSDATASESTSAAAFTAFEGAWTSASATQVTGLMAPKGKLRVSLLAPKTGGSWTLDQARRGLSGYFGSRGVSGPKLKAIAPKKGKQASKTVKVYDYTYRPHGKDVRTTRLTVTLKQDAEKQWVLASITESPKK